MTTTLIAKRTRVGGLIETEGDVVVEGRVEGTIRAAGCVTIGVAGVAVSEVDAGRALVLGILIGNLTASERVDVAAGARIIGDVRAPVVVVAAPGLIEGEVEETDVPAFDAVKSTLRLRPNQMVRPARISSGSTPVVAAPAARVDTRAPTQPMRGPMRGGPLRQPVQARPTARRLPAPGLGAELAGTAPPPPLATRGPDASTQQARPTAPSMPRPPARVRLIQRDGIVEEP